MASPQIVSRGVPHRVHPSPGRPACGAHRGAGPDPAAAGAAQADQATTVDTAASQAQVQALADKAEIVVEQYDASQTALAAAQIQLSADRAAIAAAQRTVDSTQGRRSTPIARDAYETGALGGAASVLLSHDPQAALRGADYLQRLAQNRDRQLAQATSAATRWFKRRRRAIRSSRVFRPCRRRCRPSSRPSTP